MKICSCLDYKSFCLFWVKSSESSLFNFVFEEVFHLKFILFYEV